MEIFRIAKGFSKVDPAAKGFWETLLCYPWIKAIFLHRIAHRLFQWKIPILPRLISEFSRWLTGIEVHPGAQIGSPVFVDHGMGVVMGETTVVEDHVLIYQGVTLGGTKQLAGKRHPTVKRGAIIGAGAKVLGDITIGEEARVGANAIVISDVPARHTAVSPLARISDRRAGLDTTPLHHHILIDPLVEQIEMLKKELQDLKNKLHQKTS